MNDMKNILFIYPDLSIGGSTTSLLALLSELDYSRYNVDIVFLTPVSDVDKLKLPPQVNVLPPAQQYELTSTKARIVKIIKGVFTGKVFRMLYWYAVKYRKISPIYKTTMVNQTLAQINADMSVELGKKYDVAIAFLELWATPYLIKKVKADKKIAFMHINYTGSHFAIELDKEIYDKADRIMCVSQECVDAFLSVYPQGKDRTGYLENLIDANAIRKKAQSQADEIFAQYTGFKIVTVGRIQMYTKGLDRIINSVAQLKEKDLDFRWYIIGDGNDMAACKEMAEKAGTGDNLVFLGAKENPHPYISGADLFVLPSRHEGKPMVVTEAQILATPVLVTEYASARTQVNDGVDGTVIPNEESVLAQAIINLYSDKERLTEYKENLKAKSFSNREKLEKFYNIIN